MPPRKRSKACLPAAPTTHTMEVTLAVGPGSTHGYGKSSFRGADPAQLLQSLLRRALELDGDCRELWGTHVAASVAGLPPAYSHFARDSVYNPDRTDVELRCDVLGITDSHVYYPSVLVHCGIITSIEGGTVKIFWSKFTDVPLAVLRPNPAASREPLGSFEFQDFPYALPTSSHLHVKRVYATPMCRHRLHNGCPGCKNTWISSSNMAIFLLCVQRLAASADRDRSLPKLPDDVVRSVLEPAVHDYQGSHQGTQVTVEFVPRKSEFANWKVAKLKQHLNVLDRLWLVSRDLQGMRKPQLVELAKAALTRGPITRVVHVSLINLWTGSNQPFGPMRGLAPPAVYSHACA